MFDLNIRLQIASILFFIIILINYLSKKKLPLFSTKLFTCYMIITTINLVFDILSVYALSILNTIPIELVDFIHILFYISLNSVVLFFFFYVRALAAQQKPLSFIKLLIYLIPFIISLFIILFGNIDYYIDYDKGVMYSYGISPYGVYSSCISYFILILYVTVKARTVLKEKVGYILIGSSIWIVTMIIEAFCKGYLVTCLGITLMAFLLYLSYENPKEYISSELGCFNKKAYFALMHNELQTKSNTIMINVIYNEAFTVEARFGHQFKIDIFKEIFKDLEDIFDSNKIFYLDSNSMRVLVNDSILSVEDKTSKLIETLQHPKTIDGVTIDLRSQIDIIECNKYASNIEDVVKIVSYMENNITEDTSPRKFDDELNAKMNRYIAVIGIIQDAIANGGIEMYYQPIYSIEDKRFTTAEALVRLKDNKTVGYISPDEFICIAEKQGLMKELGSLIFEKICQFISSNDLQNEGIKYVELNLSAVQCMTASLFNELSECINKYNLDPHFFNFEITETAALESEEIVRKNMFSLRKIGASFSMDDFGTGFSNLSKLVDLNYDIIKLDKSLIWPCFKSDENDAAKARMLLDNVIAMLLGLGVEIVAEGVETLEQFNYLKERKVTFIQGYYFSKPLPEKEYLAFLKKEDKSY